MKLDFFVARCKQIAENKTAKDWDFKILNLFQMYCYLDKSTQNLKDRYFNTNNVILIS